MTQRLPPTSAPGPLEEFARRFDDCFDKRSQRETFRRYLEGLLLPSERNKTLTGLANTEPVAGAQHPAAQRLQWFLSESNWDPAQVNRQRVELLMERPDTGPTERGALVVDETGDRKWGTKTAHVGRQYLGSIGKVDNGVVSVHTVWADERRYYPIDVEPYTPAGWFNKGRDDPDFRTKPAIALELVGAAIEAGVPFEAVVADAGYGQNEGFVSGLYDRGIGYVLAVGGTFAWWHREGEVGSVEEAAKSSPWRPSSSGRWERIRRRFHDEREEEWWVLEVEAGPFGPERTERLIVLTTDPATLPQITTWFLRTNLPRPGSKRARVVTLPPADLTEAVRLWGLRTWVEQTYRQVKGSLGWAEYQVRSDAAIRRHWQLVCCAFSFCWWAAAGSNYGPVDHSQPAADGQQLTATEAAAGGKTWPRRGALPELAGSPAPGPRVAGAVDHATALLARLVGPAPAGRAPGPARLPLTR